MLPASSTLMRCLAAVVRRADPDHPVRRQFIFPGALIPKADATLALRMILSQLRIPVDERVLDFKTDQIVQTAFCEVLEKLTDSDLGWRTMTQIYERELQRADHQS